MWAFVRDGYPPVLWLFFLLAFQNATFLLFTLEQCLTIDHWLCEKVQGFKQKLSVNRLPSKRTTFPEWIVCLFVTYCLPFLKWWSLTYTTLMCVSSLMYGATVWVISFLCCVCSLPQTGSLSICLWSLWFSEYLSNYCAPGVGFLRFM